MAHWPHENLKIYMVVGIEKMKKINFNFQSIIAKKIGRMFKYLKKWSFFQAFAGRVFETPGLTPYFAVKLRHKCVATPRLMNTD